jgi:hypothetical protein
MTKPEKPEWEVSMGWVGNLVLAVPLAAGAALIAWKLSIWRAMGQTLGFGFLVITFVVFFIVFYSALQWYQNRPGELAKRIPTSSKELRRRRKAFYDWLASQRRRD